MAKKKSDVAAIAGRMLKNTVTLRYTIPGGEFSFKVKLVATTKERVALIANVLSILFAGDEYRPYLKTSVSEYFLLKTYTDIPLSDILVTKDGESILNDAALDEVLCLMEDDDIRNGIVNTIGEDYTRVCAELEDAISTKKKEVEDQNSSLGKVVSAIEGILDAIGLNAEDLKNLDVSKLAGFMEKLSAVDNKQVVDYVVEHQGEIKGES